MAGVSTDELTGRRGALIEWGVAARTKTGQAASGDRHVVTFFPAGALVAAVDGLGHGSEAQAAAQAAAAILEAEPDASVIGLVRRCHEALRQTRGVVLSLASFNNRDSTLTWIGIGNVEGVVMRADRAATPSREVLLLRGGVVGYQLPQLAASVLSVAAGDTLVFATDGIRSDFGTDLSIGESPQRRANRILAQYAKGSDDALVVVVEFLGLRR
jgi:serine phosphatase RsbU (regulator of sigma subunit)